MIQCDRMCVSWGTRIKNQAIRKNGMGARQLHPVHTDLRVHEGAQCAAAATNDFHGVGGRRPKTWVQDLWATDKNPSELHCKWFMASTAPSH